MTTKSAENQLIMKKQVLGRPGAYCATVGKGTVTLQCAVQRKDDGVMMVLDELILPLDVAKQLAQFMLEQLEKGM
jgi:hypothetical protein